MRKMLAGVAIAASTGATDAIYLAAVSIPTYGVPNVWSDPDGNGTHGPERAGRSQGALHLARLHVRSGQGDRGVRAIAG